MDTLAGSQRILKSLRGLRRRLKELELHREQHDTNDVRQRRIVTFVKVCPKGKVPCLGRVCPVNDASRADDDVIEAVPGQGVCITETAAAAAQQIYNDPTARQAWLFHIQTRLDTAAADQQPAAKQRQRFLLRAAQLWDYMDPIIQSTRDVRGVREDALWKLRLEPTGGAATWSTDLTEHAASTEAASSDRKSLPLRLFETDSSGWSPVSNGHRSGVDVAVVDDETYCTWLPVDFMAEAGTGPTWGSSTLTAEHLADLAAQAPAAVFAGGWLWRQHVLPQITALLETTADERDASLVPLYATFLRHVGVFKHPDLAANVKLILATLQSQGVFPDSIQSPRVLLRLLMNMLVLLPSAAPTAEHVKDTLSRMNLTLKLAFAAGTKVSDVELFLLVSVVEHCLKAMLALIGVFRDWETHLDWQELRRVNLPMSTEAYVQLHVDVAAGTQALAGYLKSPQAQL